MTTDLIRIDNTPSFLDVKLFAIELDTWSPSTPFQTIWDNFSRGSQRRLLARIERAGHASADGVTGWPTRTWSRKVVA
jgi:hypothetical protein